MSQRLFVFAALCLAFTSLNAEARKRETIPVPAYEDQSKLPRCLDGNRQEMRSNNEEVIRWKSETQNQFKERALVVGKLVGVLLDRRSHLHLEMDMDRDQGRGNGQNNGQSNGRRGDAKESHLEVVYNKAFGEVDRVDNGMSIAACGDYITARDQSGPYKPSPVGAIIHWVHASNNPGKHSDGFLVIDGKLFGHSGEAEGRDPRDSRGWNNEFQAFFAPAL